MPSTLGAFDRLSDGCIALDRDWRYTYVNAAAGQLLGREPEVLIGRHVWTEFPTPLDIRCGSPTRPRCPSSAPSPSNRSTTVSYTHLRAHETDSYLVCRLL